MSVGQGFISALSQIILTTYVHVALLLTKRLSQCPCDEGPAGARDAGGQQGPGSVTVTAKELLRGCPGHLSPEKEEYVWLLFFLFLISLQRAQVTFIPLPPPQTRKQVLFTVLLYEQAVFYRNVGCLIMNSRNFEKKKVFI